MAEALVDRNCSVCRPVAKDIEVLEDELTSYSDTIENAANEEIRVKGLKLSDLNQWMEIHDCDLVIEEKSVLVEKRSRALRDITNVIHTREN